MKLKEWKVYQDLRPVNLKKWIKHNIIPLIWFGILTIVNTELLPYHKSLTLCAIIQIILSILFVFDVHLSRPVITMILCASLVCSPWQAKSQEEGGDGGGAPVVGIVVLCAGGYCVYKMIQFCQKHFPKNQPTTNSPPDQLSGEISGDSEAASFNLGSLGSCAGLDDHPPVTFAINGIIYPADVRRPARAVCSIVAASGKESSMNWSQFVAEAQSYGIKVTGVGDGSSYYARDGQPISESESHIHYDAQTKKVSVYSDPSKVHRLVVKRSSDLIYWEDFMHLEMEENRNFQILDTTVNGSMFYSMQLIDGD